MRELWLDDRVPDSIRAATSRHTGWLETGGPIFGYEIGTTLVVTGAAGITRARRRPWSFEPDHDEMDRLMAAVFKHSGRQVEYLGSWHTHPGGAARPSATDLNNAAAMSREPQLRLPRPLLAVAATTRRHRAATRAIAWWTWNPHRRDADPLFPFLTQVDDHLAFSNERVRRLANRTTDEPA